MTSKAQRLRERAVASVRQPKPASHLEPEARKPGYRVVAVSLYAGEADWIDRTTGLLKTGGNPKANRSLVVREAILRLKEELAEKSPQEVVRDFIERGAKRTQAQL
jgi:hypothetical protein